jgi:hypothetical protein
MSGSVSPGRGVTPRRRFAAHPSLWLGLCLAVLCAATAARAKLCGDDVQGRDVPCACGDTVVSDLTLTDDPVARTVCPGDGLIVRAIDATHGVTIDLRGKALRGTGHGTGVWIIYGGPGGARLVSSGRRARIDGFFDGVVGRGADSVALIDRIIVLRSKQDGIRVHARGYAIRNTDARASGRDGFGLNGHRYQITHTRAVDSKHIGYFVMGEGATIGAPGAGNRTKGSGHFGFNVMGVGHRLVECVAISAHKDGVRLTGMHFSVSQCRAERNEGDGITGMGGDWRLTGNRAIRNGDNGLLVNGPHVQDGGGNSGSGNGGVHPSRTSTQCQIGGAACGH